MKSDKISPNPIISTEMLAEIVQGLQDIYKGSSVAGRWYCDEHRQAVGYDPTSPDDGYYDSNHPPHGYDANGPVGEHDESASPAESLKPCEWEDYTPEEQRRWLRTCASVAKQTLEKLGVRVGDQGGVP